MAGGIIQIASYGTQDIFLSGNPEITFFRVVYRRHTNFSMETIRVDFDNDVLFGYTSTATLPKNADLIQRVYVNIDLPEINFKKGIDAGLHDDVVIPDDNETIARLTSGDEGELTVATNNYHTVDDFIRINIDAYRRAKVIYNSQNDDDAVNQMINEIDEIFDPIDEEGEADAEAQNRIDVIVETFGNLIQEKGVSSLNLVNIQVVATRFEGNTDKEEMMTQLNHAVAECRVIKEYFFRLMETKRKELADAQAENVKFAWIEKLGYGLIKQAEVEIGGHVIDRQYGDWFNIWNQLSGKRSNQQENYDKMIGNIEILTTFDRNTKPTYRLSVPLQLWFCRFNGLALPLVSLQYHDVGINIKFRRLEECCYVEKDRLISIPGVGDDLFLDEIGEDGHVKLNAHLMVQYIYLDSDERKRFAQVSHEYLIEQLTTLTFENISQLEFREELDGIHPCKEMIWVAQKDNYRRNEDGFNQCRWDNYSIADDQTGNPITYSRVEFHGYERSALHPGSYYNYLQPWSYHTATPADGINVFSMSLFPEEYQPSGSANLSRLSSVILNFVIDPMMYVENETITVTVYLRTYNILRFASGMAGCAYTTR